MSIITFMNIDPKENGQTMSAAAIATCMAIQHNYKILVVSTSFLDNTLEDCFFNKYEKDKVMKRILGKNSNKDNIFTDGMDGIARMIATGRASKDLLRDYTKPIFKDRLDLLPTPTTKDYKTYAKQAPFIPQIMELANTVYDMVIVDLSKMLPANVKRRILDISTLVIMELLQSQDSALTFKKLKEENEFFRKKNVAIAIGKYNPNSRYSAKNIGRMLNEKNIPMLVPYNILFADDCMDGKIVDYFMRLQEIKKENNDIGRDNYFISELEKTVNQIDYLRKEIELGI